MRELGDFDKAMEAHRQALQINPDNAEAHYALRYDLERAGKLDEAIECYTQV